ncbi:MAG: TIGR02186 family protein [Deltaproteobacteria bacterium]|nr:TIGR02186 family protein [Deltaproteobacteria bacterium]
MKKSIFIIIYIIMMFICGQPEFVLATASLEVTVRPNQILMGALYNGANISVMGNVPADSEVLIRLTGHLEDYKLKKKGRAMGVLWMNLGIVEIQKVPSLFLLYPSKAVNDSLQAGRQSWQDLGLGFEAVLKQANIVLDSEDKSALFEEFVKLEKKSGLYGTIKNTIHYKQGKGGMKSFSCTLALPSGLPQGVYKLDVFAIKDDAIAGYTSKEIEAKKVGMPAFITSFAFNHGTLYGVLAVLVAIIAGLVTGVIFKGEKAH